MGESTAMLSYFLLLFIVYVYLPYTIFKFATELSIDLGRRRDSTQLEEIVAGFLPCFFLHLWALGIFWVVKKLGAIENHVDIGLLASMVGDNRTLLAEYVYSAEWDGTVCYILALWTSALVNGAWFGRAVRDACKHELALGGLDEVRRDRKSILIRVRNRLKYIGRSLVKVIPMVLRRETSPADTKWHDIKNELKTWRDCSEVKLHLLPPWLWWYRFFGEAIVPLFPWHVDPPSVVAIIRTENSTWWYQGTFLSYDKTSDGRLDGLRLANATQYEWDSQSKTLVTIHRTIPVLYLRWSQIHDLRASRTKDTSSLPFVYPATKQWEPLTGTDWNPRPSAEIVKSVTLCVLSCALTVSLEAQHRPCVSLVGECNARPYGCGKKNSPEGEFNEQSRNMSVRQGADPIRMTFKQFETLQQETERLRLPPGVAVKDRWIFRNFLKVQADTVRDPGNVRSKRIGENTLVEIKGYIVGHPHARRGESANCRLLDAAYANFRFNVAELPGDSDFDSIVAEIIPQSDPQRRQWTLLKLRKIAQSRTSVLVRGKLFYDNKEIVNNDPERPVADMPARLTVWEIHPVTEILFCSHRSGECDSNGEYWQPLSQMK